MTRRQVGTTFGRGDRCEQRAIFMMHIPGAQTNRSATSSSQARVGPVLNARCSTQLPPVWLAQTQERTVSQAAHIEDIALQKARALAIKRKFVLEFFDEVRGHISRSVIFKLI